MAVQAKSRIRWWLLVVALVGVVLIIGGAVPNMVPSGNPLGSLVVGILIIIGLFLLLASLLFFLLDILALEE